MTQTITLSDIDAWQLDRFKVVMVEAREARIEQRVLQEILGGVRVERIFQDDH